VFLTQEVAGEAGFEDLLAITQVKMPVTAKLEMARNYWDEMGRGRETAMHGPLLERLATYLEIDEQLGHVVPEAVALGNAMLALARSRRYCFQVDRSTRGHRDDGPDPCGFCRCRSEAARHPYQGAGLFHAACRTRYQPFRVLEPRGSAVSFAEDPRCADAIGEGAVLRLWHGARCFERYRRHFGLDAQHSEAA
jgi:hypothetical protein